MFSCWSKCLLYCKQDENWGETQTHITSEQSVSVEDLSVPGLGRGMEHWDGGDDRSVLLVCQRYFGFLATSALALAALVSPLAMAILPKIGVFGETPTNPSRLVFHTHHNLNVIKKFFRVLKQNLSLLC
jgi:vang-like